jgi:hypothetical protein
MAIFVNLANFYHHLCFACNRHESGRVEEIKLSTEKLEIDWSFILIIVIVVVHAIGQCGPNWNNGEARGAGKNNPTGR